MKRPVATPIPVTVVTGFLGSGKTTLLQRLLVQPEARSAAVLIDEIGEIGLDHLLASPIGGPASV
jgi:G3E family GTPase